MSMVEPSKGDIFNDEAQERFLQAQNQARKTTVHSRSHPENSAKALSPLRLPRQQRRAGTGGHMGFAYRCSNYSCANADWNCLAGSRDSQVFAQAVRPRVLETGEMLFNEGDPCSAVYCIQSGLVGLRHTDEDGNSALLRLAQKGDVLGYRALLAKGMHTNTAEVLSTCRVCSIEATQLSGLVERNAALKETLFKRALADLTKSEAKCAALLTGRMKTRFLQLLTMLAEDFGTRSGPAQLVVDLPLQRKDIAALIGATPESISRLINRLETEGLVKFDGRRATITAAAAPSTSQERAPANDIAAPAEEAFAALLDARGALVSMLEAKTQASRDALNAQVQSASARLESVLPCLANGDAGAVAAFRKVWEQFKATHQSEIIPALNAGKPQTARSFVDGIQAERLAVMIEIVSARLLDAQPPRRALAH